jgi:hypothetical protein
MTIQVGLDAGETDHIHIDIGIASLQPDAIGLATSNIGSSTSATTAMQQLDNARAKLNNERARVAG